MYEVRVDKRDDKFVASLPLQDKILIKSKLLDLESGNFAGDKALKGKFKGKYRKRAGNYRIIYTKQENILLIIVINIDNRKDVYK